MRLNILPTRHVSSSAYRLTRIPATCSLYVLKSSILDTSQHPPYSHASDLLAIRLNVLLSRQRPPYSHALHRLAKRLNILLTHMPVTCSLSYLFNGKSYPEIGLAGDLLHFLPEHRGPMIPMQTAYKARYLYTGRDHLCINLVTLTLSTRLLNNLKNIPIRISPRRKYHQTQNKQNRNVRNLISVKILQAGPPLLRLSQNA